MKTEKQMVKLSESVTTAAKPSFGLFTCVAKRALQMQFVTGEAKPATVKLRTFWRLA